MRVDITPVGRPTNPDSDETHSPLLDNAASGAQESPDLSLIHVLVVDDDDAVRNSCGEMARQMGFVVVTATNIESARGVLKHRKVDLILLDLKLPGGGGLDLLREVKQLYAETYVIVMTASATVASAVEAMRIGADDYLTKPFALDELVAMLADAGEEMHFDLESRRLRERIRTQKAAGNLVGQSPEMEKLYRILSKVAHSKHPVLILGESGTGKELVARSIHLNGPSAGKLFTPVDCGSLAPAQIEAELFGYVKGAFAGAVRAKEGLLGAADGGTVYLDEISELTLDLQVKLLRALQEKMYRPMGSVTSVALVARVLGATNRDLGAMVERGQFRRDLYFRLGVVNLRIPPLRERKDDVPLLAQHFLERSRREDGKTQVFSDRALRAMLAYDWPGNVRELESAVQRACEVSSGPVIELGDLPTQLHTLSRRGGAVGVRVDVAEGAEAIVTLAAQEKQTILVTIRQLGGDKLLAAKLLGIGKTTLYRKLKEYGLSDG